MPNSESEDDVQDLDDADFDDVFAEEDGEDELLVSIENAADDATEGDPVRLACSASPRSARAATRSPSSAPASDPARRW